MCKTKRNLQDRLAFGGKVRYTFGMETKKGAPPAADGAEFTVEIYDFLPPAARAIRKAVFVREQGFVQEFDERDGKAKHVLLLFCGEPAGTCRFWPEGQEAHIGRVAVVRALRGRGAGARLLAAAETAAKEAGAKSCVLCAQVRAAGFYGRCGYAACSEVFDEEGCPHVRMRKLL